MAVDDMQQQSPRLRAVAALDENLREVPLRECGSEALGSL